jgi:phage recombination protein Bet
MTELTTLDTNRDVIIQQFNLQNGTDAEREYFFALARATGADPLRRQIHATWRNDRKLGRQVMVVVFGIDFYRKQAAASGDYAGCDEPIFSGLTQRGYPEKCTYTVYKIVQGHRVAITATVDWAEYADTYPDGNGKNLWGSKPKTMLAKCAEAHALRRGWPEQLAGTYVEEELDAGGLVEHEPAVCTDEQVDKLAALLERGGMEPGIAMQKAVRVKPAAYDRAVERAHKLIEESPYVVDAEPVDSEEDQ